MKLYFFLKNIINIWKKFLHQISHFVVIWPYILAFYKKKKKNQIFIYLYIFYFSFWRVFENFLENNKDLYTCVFKVHVKYYLTLCRKSTFVNEWNQHDYKNYISKILPLLKILKIF